MDALLGKFAAGSIGLGVLIGIAFALGLAWLLRTSIASFLKKHVDKDLQQHHFTLEKELANWKMGLEIANQQRTDQIKSEALRELERLKSDLQSQNEALKHQLQIERLKLEMANKQRHEVYADLLEKLRKAEGAVGGLWGPRFSINYGDYSVGDLIAVVEKQKVPDGMKAELIALLRQDRKEGLQRLEALLRRIELRDARNLLFDTMNHVLLKALWMSRPVKEGALLVHKKLSDAHVEVEVGELDPSGKMGKQWGSLVAEAKEALDALEDAMRRELWPAAT